MYTHSSPENAIASHEKASSLLEKFRQSMVEAKEKIMDALENLVSVQQLEVAQEKIMHTIRSKYVPLILLSLGAASVPNNETTAQNNLMRIEIGANSGYTDIYLDESHAPNGAYAELGWDHRGNDSKIGIQVNGELHHLQRKETIDEHILSQYKTTLVGISASPYITIGAYGLNDYREQGGGLNIGLGGGVMMAWSEYTHPNTHATLEDQQMVYFIEPKIAYRRYTNGTEKGIELSAQFLQGKNGDTALDGNPLGSDNDINFKAGIYIAF